MILWHVFESEFCILFAFVPFDWLSFAFVLGLFVKSELSNVDSAAFEI